VLEGKTFQKSVVTPTVLKSQIGKNFFWKSDFEKTKPAPNKSESQCSSTAVWMLEILRCDVVSWICEL